MKMTVLLENRTRREDMLCTHGLSLYIEAGDRKILFDMGADDKFVENAKTLGIDLAEVDTAILSHGHDDHAGGMAAFCAVNSKAKIYVQKDAFGEYYEERNGERVYAGINREFLNLRERIVFTGGRMQLDPTVTLFSDVRGDQYHIPMNDGMQELRRGIFMQDEFRHEQNAIITEGSKRVLLTGCAHRGIINILQRCEEIIGRTPDAVVGGFHLYNPATGDLPEEELISGIAAEFSKRSCLCATGHCTGIAGHRVLHNVLGDRCKYLFCGKTIEI